jgi:hypothetical protein
MKTKTAEGRQLSFSQVEYTGKKKQTRRNQFLGQMEQVVP